MTTAPKAKTSSTAKSGHRKGALPNENALPGESVSIGGSGVTVNEASPAPRGAVARGPVDRPPAAEGAAGTPDVDPGCPESPE